MTHHKVPVFFYIVFLSTFKRLHFESGEFIWLENMAFNTNTNTEYLWKKAE